MAQLAILNYETATVELINLSEDTVLKYANNYDNLVYKTMGYKKSSVYYMIANKISMCEIDEEVRLKR